MRLDRGFVAIEVMRAVGYLFTSHCDMKSMK
jgi:hypothetical protein